MKSSYHFLGLLVVLLLGSFQMRGMERSLAVNEDMEEEGAVDEYRRSACIRALRKILPCLRKKEATKCSQCGMSIEPSDEVLDDGQTHTTCPEETVTETSTLRSSSRQRKCQKCGRKCQECGTAMKEYRRSCKYDGCIRASIEFAKSHPVIFWVYVVPGSLAVYAGLCYGGSRLLHLIWGHIHKSH